MTPLAARGPGGEPGRDPLRARRARRGHPGPRAARARVVAGDLRPGRRRPASPREAADAGGGRRGHARRRRHRGRGRRRPRGGPGRDGAAARAATRTSSRGRSAGRTRPARRCRCSPAPWPAGRVRDARLGLLRMGGQDGSERVFAVNAGIGLDAATVEWIEARPRTKRRLRQAGFVLGAAIAAGRSSRAPHLRARRRRRGARCSRARCSPRAGPPTPTSAGGPSTSCPARPSTGAWPGWALTRIHPAELAPPRPAGGARRATCRSAPAPWPAARSRASWSWRATCPRPSRPTASRSAATARCGSRTVPLLRAVEPRPG